MDSKIQQLTEAIYNEGIQKARDEADDILKKAHQKAAQIEEEAQKAAVSVMADTRKKAQEFKNHVDSELRMTINQAISAMKQQVASLVSMNVIQPPVKETFADKEYLKSLINGIVKGWMEKESFDMNVILPEGDKVTMEKFFKQSLAAEMNKGLEFSFSPDVRTGFKIGPADGSYLISFTDDDFLNFLKAYLRPKTSHLLFGEEK
ncbi:MAG: V-type ATP synthase subunit E [Bacteroidota bacterium]|nr:V-type ATP synthase subunit E [Bacteroidota bacterium]HOF54796.1 V-type ATP synthase subunit E [Prolixibacteraceae bacterium]HOR99761.1 V-type ATP synthase subunit E [Prolixibacteraceae bacterium]HOS89651.1 V-type ATP synthase subunit E [Prolixibacteraceae bacterium]HPL44653.1 V-type ATP synthase subunit E [Prolixibacteraceae bacterium]